MLIRALGTVQGHQCTPRVEWHLSALQLTISNVPLRPKSLAQVGWFHEECGEETIRRLSLARAHARGGYTAVKHHTPDGSTWKRCTLIIRSRVRLHLGRAPC
eukprot:4858501-Prymnesium_polylepis.1